MSDNAIEVHGLSKRFVVHQERRRSLKEIAARGRTPGKRYFWALQDATFAVPAGSSLGIIGHNGSGKSTALKVLTGIYRPTSGHVRVHGSVAALLEVGAGFHPELTGRENIRLNATILGFTGRQIDAMMDQIIEFADIGDHIDAPIKHYSSGMYVRLGFAVAVMVKPEILIVDEVIAVGDEEFQRKCYDHLQRLRQQGTTMVIVSHGLGHITNLCDQALWLDHGRVRALDRAHDVVRAYLDDVNRRELERAAARELAAQQAQARLTATNPATLTAPEPVPDAPVPARRGSGEVRLSAVEFIDDDGVGSSVLLSGRPATFRLCLRVDQPCTISSIGLTVHDESEALMTVMGSSPEQAWRLDAGEACLDFRADPLLLAGGAYRIRVEIHVDGHLADAQDEPRALTVRDIEEDAEGVFRQPGAWTSADVTSAVGNAAATAPPGGPS